MLEKERSLYEVQIDRFINRLKTLFYEEEILLKAEYCHFGPKTPTYAHRKDGKYKPISVGDTWGKNWEQAWFHLQGEVPKNWKGKQVAARINLGGEGAIFDNNGTPIFALSFHSLWMTEFSRDRYIISKKAKGGESVDIWIDATAAQLFGLQLMNDPKPTDVHKYGHYEATVKDLALGIFREDIWQLYMDAFVLNDLMLALPEKSVRRARILQTLRAATDAFLGDAKNVAGLRKQLKEVLGKRSNASALNAIGVGHAHIDTAWLWPLHETRKKCARSFTAQLDLIDRYPGYIFGASQAQHYQFIKEDHPALYERMKRQIKSGNWEVQGGMWVEADCNLISGESMVRQFLHGMNFFKDEFGVTVKNLWLPDVFGYSAAMPQVLQGFDIPVMVTQKISWNQFNKFPHHTFNWRGIDGSEIVVHFPPEDTYNSELKPASLRHAEENYTEKAILDDFLVVYGIGDGGGGPTEDILEAGIRQRNLEGTPRLKFSAAQPLLDKFVRRRSKLPRWVGELYLELHRGTLTTQAYNKKVNRFMELKLRELECLYAAFAYENYPAMQFDAIWKTVLLNQFHDIIPGSSINPVYKDSHAQYENLCEDVKILFEGFLRLKQGKSPVALSCFNSLSFESSRPLQLPDDWVGHELLDENGKAVDTQLVGKAEYILPTVEALSVRTFFRGKEKPRKSASVKKKTRVLENDLVLYEFDKNGEIIRGYDKECQREIFRKGQRGNVLGLYEDRPNAWDAWDVDIFYENQLRETAALQSWQWISAGPLLQVVDTAYTIGNSRIEQRIILAANSKRLEFRTEVEWQETHKMLRTGFTVDIHAVEATYEIQYGSIKRPTHRNTSWDMARFEVVGHRYADLSDSQYGVALLNDCKYGHKIYDNYLELNLLRSPNMPDPDADRGSHLFTYALLPHDKSWQESTVISEAHQLNQPVSSLPGILGESLHFPVQLSNETVILEVLKKAEKEDALILRLYEPVGKQANIDLKFHAADLKVYETKMLETGGRSVRIKNGQVNLSFRPFEIKTLKLVQK